MEWTRDKTLALINEYRKRRELWDMTHEDYRKKEMKMKFLNEVSINLGGNIPIVEIEKKFHTLRTQYHREINRIKRKENYNSKWFGFKNLQFLSSPKACRSNKGRIKSEITEEGTLTTKFIITENLNDTAPAHETSVGSVNSGNTPMSDDFITIHGKPAATISYETTATSRANHSQSGTTTTTIVTGTNRCLEKLIEETTKDVEEEEDSKPKVTIKEITVPIDNTGYATQHHATASGDTDVMAAHTGHQEHEQQETHSHHHHHHNQQQESLEEEVVEPLESIEIQNADGEITYHHHHQAGSVQATAHSLPRIIKIQRRDTISGHEEEYYEHHIPHQHQQQQPQQHQHIQTIPAATKRIYYDSNGQHTATILTPTTTSTPQSTINGTSSLLPTPAKVHRPSLLSQPHSPTSSPTQQQQNTIRDEFTTYGEYVANEMRNLTNREVLIALKHKINTSLFEASMAELQK